MTDTTRKRITVTVSDQPDISCWAGVTTIVPSSVDVTYYRHEAPTVSVSGMTRSGKDGTAPGSWASLLFFANTVRPDWLAQLVADYRPKGWHDWTA